MKALLLSDAEFKNDGYNEVTSVLYSFFEGKNIKLDHIETATNELAYCTGCFGCWIKKPGECVMQDKIAQINQMSMNSDVVVYIVPIVFGQFSANMKNVIDRWLPNMLPFFELRKDGMTMHPPRYSDYPSHIMIGYAKGLSDQDEQLFTDINKKHRKNVEVLFWKDSKEKLYKELGSLSLSRKGGEL